MKEDFYRAGKVFQSVGQPLQRLGEGNILIKFGDQKVAQPGWSQDMRRDVRGGEASSSSTGRVAFKVL